MIINYDISKDRLDLKPESIAQILSGSSSSALLEKQINEDKFRKTFHYVKDNFLHMIEPQCITKTIPVNLFREVFRESLPDYSPVYQAAQHWYYAAIFIATIGNFIEMSIQNLLEQGDIYTSSVLDAAASVLVESTVGIAQEKWMNCQKISPKNKRLMYSTRYSPGYCSWNISGQAALFGYAADADINVKLMDDYSLQPRKSISGIMVIEEHDLNSSLYRACSICEDKCRYMRVIKKDPETDPG
jgi:hypothetical protein